MKLQLSFLTAVVISYLFLSIPSVFPSTVSSRSLQPQQTVLDGHVHLTNTSILDYLWATPNAGICPCAPPCLCNWTTLDYANAQGILSTTKFVFVEVDVNSSQFLDEAVWVQSLATVNPALGGIVAQQPPGFADPESSYEDLEASFISLSLLPLVKGIRVSNVTYSDPSQILSLINHTQLLLQYDLSMDINTGLTVPGTVDGILHLVRTFPGITFILDHMGSVPVLANSSVQAVWNNSIQVLGKEPNLYVKVGGILQGYKSSGVIPTVEQITPYVTTVINSFGFERSFYEGNWFFCDWSKPANLSVLAVWQSYIDTILTGMGAGPGTVERNQFLYETGSRAYRVDM